MPTPLQHAPSVAAHTDVKDVAASGVVGFFHSLFIEHWYAWPVLIGLFWFYWKRRKADSGSGGGGGAFDAAPGGASGALDKLKDIGPKRGPKNF